MTTQRTSGGSGAVHGREPLDLSVRDLGRSVAFYRALLGTNPVEVRPRYARFELGGGRSLSLTRCRDATRSAEGPLVLHLASERAVAAVGARLAAARVPRIADGEARCGYALAVTGRSEVRAVGPDGERWVVRSEGAASAAAPDESGSDAA